jgi:hypothetical protein
VTIIKPEVLKPVGVNLAVDVLNRVIHNAVLEFGQAIVGLQCTRVKRGTGRNVLADFRLQRMSQTT